MLKLTLVPYDSFSGGLKFASVTYDLVFSSAFKFARFTVILWYLSL
jgi:hypothetical protein